MSLLRILFLASIALGTAGCGFQPIYRAPAAGEPGVAAELSRIGIAPVQVTRNNRLARPYRLGQQLTNDLLDLLTPRGRPASPRYTLLVRASENRQDLAVQESSFATRSNLRLLTDYQLTDNRTGRVIFSSSSRAVSSFNILASEFATLQHQRSARVRAISRVAQDMRLKLAAALRDHLTGNGLK